MIEEWRPIEYAYGTFTRYEVSNLGNVRTIHVNKQGQDTGWHIKTKYKKYKSGTNYCFWAVGLQTPKRNGRCGEFYVHRLVADAFIPNPGNNRFIKHIDGDNFNNNVNNLRWSKFADWETTRENFALCVIYQKVKRAHYKTLLEKNERFEKIRREWVEGKCTAEEVCAELFKD